MRKFTLFTIFFTVFLDILGFGIIIPLLPFYAKEFGANELVIGTLMASNGVAQFIFNPILGMYSDKFGRRPIMLITVIGSGIAYYLFGIATSIFMLFVSRILAGIAGATIGVAQSCISDLTTKEERSKILGMLGASFSLGFVFGPILSGFLSQISFQLPGYVAAGLALLNAILVFFFLPESNKNIGKIENKKKILDIEAFKTVIKNPDISALMLIQFISMLSMSNLFSTCALFLQAKFNYTVVESAYMFTFFGICSTIVQGFVVGKLTKKYPEANLLVISGVFMTVGMAMMPFMPSLYPLLLSAAIIFLGNGIMNTCLTSMITQNANQNEIGFTLGVSQSLNSLARIFGPLWGGFIFYAAGYHFPYLTAALFGIVVIVLSSKFLSKSKEKPVVLE